MPAVWRGLSHGVIQFRAVSAQHADMDAIEFPAVPAGATCAELAQIIREHLARHPDDAESRLLLAWLESAEPAARPN